MMIHSDHTIKYPPFRFVIAQTLMIYNQAEKSDGFLFKDILKAIMLGRFRQNSNGPTNTIWRLSYTMQCYYLSRRHSRGFYNLEWYVKGFGFSMSVQQTF